jgi:hypothetical protein
MASWVVYPTQTSQPPNFTEPVKRSTRRQHSKSRTGCTICKRRRIKCDETRPACNQCVEYGRQCSFLDTGLQSLSRGMRQSSAHNGNASSDELFARVWEKLRSRAELLTTAKLSIQKAYVRKLLHHLVHCKGEWLAAPIFQQILQQHGVQLGLRSDYLLHALLAVTASHMYFLDTTEAELKLLSSFHYSLSLRLYREKLSNIQSDDVDAIFACGIIHTILVIRYTILDALTIGDTLGGFDSLVVSLLNGLKAIKSFPPFHCPFQQADRESKSQYPSLFPASYNEQEWTANIDVEVSKITAHIAELESNLLQLVGKAVFEDIYREPFQYLALASQRDPGHSPIDLIFSFSFQLNDRYLKSLELQTPVALLLLCYWLALLTAINQWWITKPAIALCKRFHAHLSNVLPAAKQGTALLAPIVRAIRLDSDE